MGDLVEFAALLVREVFANLDAGSRVVECARVVELDVSRSSEGDVFWRGRLACWTAGYVEAVDE